MRRRFIVFLILFIILLASALPVGAHPIVVRTDPADGATLDEAPTQLTVWFTEPVLLDFTVIELFDGEGQRLPVSAIRSADDDPTVLVIDLPELKSGAYRLLWRTVADDDLHIVNGAVVFGVEYAVEAASNAALSVTPGAAEVTLRWLNQIALMIVIGALALNSLVLPAATRYARISYSRSMPVRLRLLRLAQWATFIGLLAGLSMMAYQVITAGSLAANETTNGITRALQIMIGTSYGTQWLLRNVLLAVLVGLFVILLPGESIFDQDESAELTRYSTLTLAAVPILAALIISQALHSHMAAVESAPVIGVIADTAHLLAASVWVGSLIVLALIIVPLLRRDPIASALARSILRHFGWLAAVCVAVLTITGLYNSGQLVASLDALLTTTYGGALLLKIALAVTIGCAGLFNAAALHPRVNSWLPERLKRSPSHLRRTLVIETGGAALLLVVVAWLGASQPARGPEFDPPVDSITTLTANAADLLLTTSIKPNRPGQNFINVDVANTRRPAPAPIASVIVQLTRSDGALKPIVLEAELLEPGRYQITSNIDRPGEWRLAVTVIRSGLAEAAIATNWQVLPAASSIHPRPLLISNQPLAPLLTTSAVLLAIVLSGVCAGWGLRRQRRRAQPADRRSIRYLLKD